MISDVVTGHFVKDLKESISKPYLPGKTQSCHKTFRKNELTVKMKRLFVYRVRCGYMACNWSRFSKQKMSGSPVNLTNREHFNHHTTVEISWFFRFKKFTENIGLPVI